MSTPFELTKWYLDGVSPGGTAVIAYWAELRWHRLSGHYASVLRCADGALDEQFSLRPGPPPVIAQSGVAWDCAPLEFSGTWTGPYAPEGEHTLASRSAGRVSWRCLQPRAEVALALRGERFVGRGYTECLSLTLPPWELPIDTLRWGRAHAGSHSVVWVDWSGAESCHLVLVDGRARMNGVVTDDAVTAAGLRLNLGPRTLLRGGTIEETTVGRVPGLTEVLAAVGLRLDERKWLSPCTLELDGATASGSALHEVIRWG